MTEFVIREEMQSDRERVDAVQKAAFERADEAELVCALRASAEPQLSLVAELGGEVVGHIFFSPVRVEGSASSPPAAGLAPLAVAPAVQRQGAGSALVRAGLRACPPLGWQAVFLLGDPDYYARFGFILAAPLGLRYESEAFDSGFQVTELAPGALAGCTGWVHYHEAFRRL